MSLNTYRVQKKNKVVQDVLLDPKPDRRQLPNVPDFENIRTNNDRRGKSVLGNTPNAEVPDLVKSTQAGIRYRVNYQVKVTCIMPGKEKHHFTVPGIDISTTGILLHLANDVQAEYAQQAKTVKLTFEITPGSMPEGYEMKVKKIKAKAVRVQKQKDNTTFCGMVFEQPLSQYSDNHKDRYALMVSSIFLFFIVCFIMLMRAESIIYFKFNQTLYLYSIIAAVFLLSRYLFGALYHPEKIDMDFTPGVTIIIPCFNEEEWIQKTIVSCVNQDYPLDKLEVIVVDDCSNDNSVQKIQEIIEELRKDDGRYKTTERLRYFVQTQNKGKRDALARGVLAAKHELVVFVDSDSFLDPYAIRHLVMPFKDPKMAGVSGRTEVANTYTNVLTKMQSVRYYIAFRIMKAAEAYFDAVTCLSGPLSCYRKEIVINHLDEWLNQKFLGRRATFGDDRSMTNLMLRNYRTGYQDSAVCSTIVPNRYKTFLKQQMRWKRSWLRESIIAGSFMWKKEPFMAVFFYMGLIVPVAAPIVVFYNLFYVPIMHRVFPLAFLMGLFMMAMLMSVVQLFLKKSSTWLFGLVFCLFYEAVLLWQMPIAWFTFWKSTWGTRQTPEDIAAQERKRQAKQRRQYSSADFSADAPQKAAETPVTQGATSQKQPSSAAFSTAKTAPYRPEAPKKGKHVPKHYASSSSQASIWPSYSEQKPPKKKSQGKYSRRSSTLINADIYVMEGAEQQKDEHTTTH